MVCSGTKTPLFSASLLFLAPPSGQNSPLPVSPLADLRRVGGRDSVWRRDPVRPESEGQQTGSVHLPGVQQAQRRRQHLQGQCQSHRGRHVSRQCGQRWWFQLLVPPAVSGLVPQPPSDTHTHLADHTHTHTHTVLRARKEQQHARLHLQTQTDSCFLSSSCLLLHAPDVPSTIFCCFLSLPRRVEVRQEPSAEKC